MRMLDISPQATDTVRLKTEVKRDCSTGTDQCPALPQFCPHTDCVPDTVSWLDITKPEKIRRGCINSIGVGFVSSYWCLSRAAAGHPQTQTVGGVVQVDIYRLGFSGTLLQCQPWTDTEPCNNQQVTTENRQVSSTNTFREGVTLFPRTEFSLDPKKYQHALKVLT